MVVLLSLCDELHRVYAKLMDVNSLLYYLPPYFPDNTFHKYLLEIKNITVYLIVIFILAYHTISSNTLTRYIFVVSWQELKKMYYIVFFFNISFLIDYYLSMEIYF